MIIQVSSSISEPTLVVTPNLSLFASASAFATTASYAEMALSASYAPQAAAAATASYALRAKDGDTAVSASYALSASYVPTNGLISGSSQIEHDLTTGYSASRHIDHASVLMVAGDGLSGGGNIQASRTFRLDTGSTHFVEGVKVVPVNSSSYAILATTASYARNVSDGLVSGGILQINTDTTKFNILGGYGTILYDPENIQTPTIYNVSWTSSFGLSTPFLNSDTITYVLVDRTGSFVYQTSTPTDFDFRDKIYLGYVSHTNRTTIATAVTQPDVASKPIGQIRDLYRALGYVKEGLIISAYDSTLGINRGAGSLTGLGVGYTSTPYVPNFKSFIAVTSASFSHRTTAGSGSNNVTVLDVGNYDVGGIITPVGGNTSTSTNMRVFGAVNGNIIVQYGQQTYTNLADAVAGIPSENFTTYKNLENAALLAIISVRRNATQLNNPAQAVITNVGKLGEANSIGAGLSAVAQYSGSFTGSLTGSRVEVSTISGTLLHISGGFAAHSKPIPPYLTASSSAGATYTSAEQNLLNQIRQTLIDYGLLQ